MRLSTTSLRLISMAASSCTVLPLTASSSLPEGKSATASPCGVCSITHEQVSTFDYRLACLLAKTMELQGCGVACCDPGVKAGQPAKCEMRNITCKAALPTTSKGLKLRVTSCNSRSGHIVCWLKPLDVTQPMQQSECSGWMLR